MSKRTKGNFIVIPRELFDDNNHVILSDSALRLYLVLTELEMQLTPNDGSRDYFYRTNSRLAEDTGMGIATVARAKKELREKRLVYFQNANFANEDGSKSERHVTAIRLLR